ncbi:peptide ABC transporter substrate-binding protein [Candidatus Chloroploca sp. M-50]|uniref:Peptide ABC transporter substrate-binding protein n=1 Tax=Candidatus Chloroploca mongolica TaxID=2528176 RepID=A0ABS4DAY4_9CHLR|nr:peptide ABC transporter substrate-binding protein [Candidatus Chloroploca mongolica]MBP1466584.1 peptide ABC transporter substrate-binding protein [Candidatus Chloroploca mongolica]
MQGANKIAFSTHRAWVVIALLLVLSLSLGACVQEAKEPLSGPVPSPEAASGGTLIMTLGSRDPTTLDPALVGDVTSAFVTRQIFSGLVRLDKDLEVEPDLAESWERSEDGRSYTFRLRPTANFADGRPITAEDVRYSLERATDPRLGAMLPSATYLGDIVGVAEKLAGTASTISGLEVLDERTIVLTIDAPKGFFLAKLAHPTSFVVDQQAVESGRRDWTEQPNGSGPFTIERWERNQLLVLARNPHFAREPARLDRVQMLIGAAASNPLILYEQGQIDLTSVPSFALARIQDDNNPLAAELRQEPQLSLFYLGMNANLPPFDDANIREAFRLLIDRSLLTNVTLQGTAESAYGVLPPGMPGYNEQLTPLEPDGERIRELIATSRYGSVEALPPIIAYGSWASLLSDVAEATLGITIEVRDYEDFGDYLAALEENRFQIFGTGWIADYPDPENFLDVLFRSGSGQNHMAYSNPDVDLLLNQAAVEPDDNKRYALYQEIEARIMADSPIIPLYHDVEHMLVKPYVRGLELTPMGVLDLSTVELVRP